MRYGLPIFHLLLGLEKGHFQNKILEKKDFSSNGNIIRSIVKVRILCSNLSKKKIAFTKKRFRKDAESFFWGIEKDFRTFFLTSGFVSSFSPLSQFFF